jgi:hypothetical protein
MARIWESLREVRNASSFQIYAFYVISILNDKESGRRLYQVAENINRQARARRFVLDKAGEKEDDDEKGKIFLSLDPATFGVMKKVNMAAHSLFGYQQGELSGRRVNQIMPLAYSHFHDQFLTNYDRTGSTMLINKERTILGKNSAGYVF